MATKTLIVGVNVTGGVISNILTELASHFDGSFDTLLFGHEERHVVALKPKLIPHMGIGGQFLCANFQSMDAMLTRFPATAYSRVIVVINNCEGLPEETARLQGILNGNNSLINWYNNKKGENTTVHVLHLISKRVSDEFTVAQLKPDSEFHYANYVPVDRSQGGNELDLFAEAGVLAWLFADDVKQGNSATRTFTIAELQQILKEKFSK